MKNLYECDLDTINSALAVFEVQDKIYNDAYERMCTKYMEYVNSNWIRRWFFERIIVGSKGRNHCILAETDFAVYNEARKHGSIYQDEDNFFYCGQRFNDYNTYKSLNNINSILKHDKKYFLDQESMSFVSRMLVDIKIDGNI